MGRRFIAGGQPPSSGYQGANSRDPGWGGPPELPPPLAATGLRVAGAGAAAVVAAPVERRRGRSGSWCRRRREWGWGTGARSAGVAAEPAAAGSRS